jgi:syntaxin 1B/2/3
LAEKTNKTIKSTIELLTQLKECTMNEPEAGNNDHTMESVVKIRCNVIAACSRKLRDEVALYRRAQEAFHGEIQRKIKRQLKIIDPAVSDETVSAIVSSGESSHVVMKEQILQEKAVNQKIKDSCLQVHSKCQDILMLEKSIQQIHQLFLDMAVLTELQGSTLDQLNIHVHEATRYTEDANKHLEEACHSQKRIRNKQCRLALIALVVVVVVVIIVF